MKKWLALLLAGAMALSMVACGNETPAGDETTKAPVSGETQENETPAVVDGKDTYTYNLAAQVFPTNWNVHDYETNDDAQILDYIVSGFFTFDYNDTLDGYKIVPYMAVSEPEDVTAEYAADWGIPADAKSRAWKLTLRDDLMWEDGTPIVAADFVKSAELLLNPLAQNYRADSLYMGDLALINAKDFLYQGQHVFATPMINADLSGYLTADQFTTNADGYYFVGEQDVAISLTKATMWSSNTLADYYGAYPDWFQKDGVDMYETVLKAQADADGWVKATDEVVAILNQFIACAHSYATIEDYYAAEGDYAYQEWQEFASYGATYGEMTIDQVGIVAPSDNELVLILEKPLEGFYLLYNLTSSWLVNEPLYTSCESVVDGVYNNTYGTSVETTISYGPYKLTAFQADKQYILERNDNHFDVKAGGYQTTHIQVDYVAEASARKEMMLKGQLDSFGLDANDMETYGASDYTYYTTGDSTFFMALNPHMENLKTSQAKLGDNYNKTILTVEEFRQGLAYAIDRAAFALATSPTNSPAFGVFSSLIISDPENGIAYRTTDEAKWVLARFWGLAEDIGAGKLYETVDDAVESITGYNLEMAKQMFDAAYDKAISEGLMDADDTISIMIGTPSATSNFYVKGYDYLVNCYTEAVKGTKLEGKLEFTLDDTLGNGYADALKANQVDMLFGVGWTGSALDPYGLVEAYTTSGYQYNPSWDTSVEMATVEIDGVKYTASVLDWTYCLGGEEITITAEDGTTKTFKAGSSDGVDEARFAILTVMENAILETYHLIPLIDDASASLKGMQIEFYTEEYIYGVGRGGVKYMSYNYTDAEWNDFVASQGGSLNYN